MEHYQIIEAMTTTELEELVRGEMVSGWEPVGGAVPAMFPIAPNQQYVGRVQLAVTAWYQTMSRDYDD